MNEPVLLVQLAGQRIALPAIEIDSVIDLDNITPVPGAPRFIAGLSTLRSRALTVVDGGQTLGHKKHVQKTGQQAAVFNFEGHDYALLVDAVEDVVEAATDPTPIPGGAGKAWSSISDGVIETAVGSAMLVNPFVFIKNSTEQRH